MTRRVTWDGWSDRIGRVSRWIADHLDHPLDLDRMAEIACFSPYHFHRVYRGVMGETVTDTVRRLRLQRAADTLIRTDAAITQVAAKAGYGSVAAFTRAFKADYGMPPAAYRARREAWRPDTAHPFGDPNMYEMIIRDTPDLRLATMPHTGSYLAIGKTFEAMTPIVAGQGLFGPGTILVGVYLDDPRAVAEPALRSFAGVTIEPHQTPMPPLSTQTVVGGRTAVLRFVGPYSELHVAYDWLFSTWLPSAAVEPRDQPCYEVYRNDPRQVPARDLVTEIHVPLV